MNLQHIILKGIKELLYLHDYLVLPDFGGFVLKSKSSHYSRSGGQIIPPSKTVSFNVQLKQNDGLLMVWLQNSITCNASEALQHLKEFSNYCSGVLSAKKRLNMEGLGFFYIDFENNICFEPQQDVNYLSDSFGLGAINVHPIEIDAPETIKESVFVDRQLSEKNSGTAVTKKSKRFKHIVTPLIVASLSLSLLLLIVSNLRISGLMYSSVIGTKTTGLYEPINYKNIDLITPALRNVNYVADANGIASIKISDKKTISVLALENKLTTSHSNNSGLKFGQKKFEIVLGCFSVLSNAKRMHKNLQSKHLKTSISSKNSKGMYVVSSGDFESKEEAVSRLETLKQTYPKAWIKSSE